MNEPARMINGAFLRQRREGKGWAQTDLATRACLSLRQVRQIEDGGNSSFYSESVKATSARKIATLLGLPPESAFVQAHADTVSVNPVTDPLTPTDNEQAPAPVVAQPPHAPGPAGADLSSVMTHVAVATADIDPPPPQSLSSAGGEGESRSSGFLWLAVLAVAVCAGVLLMPKSSDVPQTPNMAAPVDPNPPAPPPMVLPADSVEASGNQPSDAPLAAPGTITLPAVPPSGSGLGAAGLVTPMPNSVAPAPAPTNGPIKPP
jgi:transcriptional regulator with XRE-family HTH domain